MSFVKWVCETKSVTGCWRRDNEMWGEGVWAAGLEGGEHGVCNTFGVKRARLEPCAGPLEGRDVPGLCLARELSVPGEMRLMHFPGSGTQ